MGGYFGTDKQRRLQAQAEEAADFIARTVGACQAGRTMGCDDPKLFGWQAIAEIVARDGVCGFRMIDTADVPEIKAELAARGCRFDTWDVFVGEGETALAASRRITAAPWPEGLSLWPTPDDGEDQQIRDTQGLMASAGLVPFSGSMLAGKFGPAVTVTLGDAFGIVAAAHAYMPHNAFSRFGSYAWGGLVAVRPSHRGQGLGKLVNALMIEQLFGALPASHVYELVSASNTASRRMVEACGLRHAPELTCGIATAQKNDRFTA